MCSFCINAFVVWSTTDIGIRRAVPKMFEWKTKMINICILDSHPLFNFFFACISLFQKWSRYSLIYVICFYGVFCVCLAMWSLLYKCGLFSFFEFNFQFFKFQFYIFFSILSCYIACLIKYVSTTYIIGIPLAAAEPCGTMDTMRVRVCHIC